MHILPGSFPYPMDDAPTTKTICYNIINHSRDYRKPKNTSTQARFLTIPTHRRQHHITRKPLTRTVPSRTFNHNPPFLTMNASPLAQEGARHSPITIAYNWNSNMKANMDDDAARGKITPVQIGYSAE